MQMELYAFSRLDERGVSHPQALPHEVWHWAMGANPGNRPAPWKAHTAAERRHTAAIRAAESCRYARSLRLCW